MWGSEHGQTEGAVGQSEIPLSLFPSLGNVPLLGCFKNIDPDFGTRQNQVPKILHSQANDPPLLVSDSSFPSHRNSIQGNIQRQEEIDFGEASKKNFPLWSPYLAFPELSFIWKVLCEEMFFLLGPSE